MTDPYPPAWLDRAAYPFAGRHLATPEGRLHYLDEGNGPPVVLVHGTPTWSFLWRHVVSGLAQKYRVIVPDHLGFGLSDKPPHAGYTPADHARRLTALLAHLDVRDATLVVHDFGGPIGLAHAIAHPDRVSRLVLCNTWLWDLGGDPRMARGGRLAAGPIGRFLYRRLNFSPRVLIPAGFGDRRALTPAVHRQYLAPFPSAADREAPAALARALLAEGAWYERLWQRRAALQGKPALLLWGMRDPAFGPAYLARWREALPQARVVEYADAGHFVPEEVGGALLPELRRFLDAPTREAA
ncbi:alpha/beta fold hydrolase [Roseisolibacter sp. H3M3-2]|uniref:alpha/beta fold hydrolase n=1 Tax=Roseisolibacter sp. H3M3-2 TaxID=3031323 RepID=UPI0023DC57D8|nr:alpha/beta fold hydrolase [Roseisolibacter sp. H3M3-2]MDF1502228.1 alpha/beta fold hydrolase [Roseisolibacter sp. H3M3-2]